MPNRSRLGGALTGGAEAVRQPPAAAGVAPKASASAASALLRPNGHVAPGGLRRRERLPAAGEQQLGRLLAVPQRDARRGGLGARGARADAVDDVDGLAE